MKKNYVSLTMSKEYYSKDNCVNKAIELLDNGDIRDMSKPSLTKEIYAHAYVYYNFDRLPEWFKKTWFAKKVFESCDNGIDLADGGDLWFKKIFYEVVWLIPKKDK